MPSAESVKSILRQLLSRAEAPLTSTELWAAAESEGLKSKRHMKQMLAQVRCLLQTKYLLSCQLNAN